MMVYNRETQELKKTPVENGLPLQGTWTNAFDEVDLSRVHRPYSLPLPKSINNLRIKEWESFIIQDERFFLHAGLFNFKFFRMARVTVFNKETGKTLDYKKIYPGGGWRLPRNLHNDSVDSRSWGFFFRIHSWLYAKSINLELNIGRTLQKPEFTSHATFDFEAGKTTSMAVSLLFTERRNMCAYKALTAVSGDVVSDGQHFHLDPAKTSGLFCDYKGYYPYLMRSAWCSGFGFDGKNNRFGFSLGENQARETYKNNENALWVDGRLTPLPPVKITQNNGPESEWIIQDMEGMVDLVFTPKSYGYDTMNFIIANYEYENPIGCFNGLVVNAEGEKIPIHNVWGTGEKQYLRV